MRKIYLSICTVVFLAACGGSNEVPTVAEKVNTPTPAKAPTNNPTDKVPVKFENDKPVDTPIADNVNVDAPAELTFTVKEYDFGTIKQGETVEYDFEITNTGKSPLIISGARSTCGCTVPEPPKEPIAPGESDVIHVKFNSTGKRGAISKPINVTANTYPNAVTTANIKGFVEVPETTDSK